jgi:hypothetical protein
MNQRSSKPDPGGKSGRTPKDAGKEDAKDIVVFSTLRDSSCTECGKELLKGCLLRVEKDKALCLACADLDHLTYLPRGDTALTRRATRHSTLRAVVVRFSRTRGRYERQGILVEEPALEQAERECLADAPARDRSRERAAERRAKLDESYVDEFAKRLNALYPGCPVEECGAIAAHACQKYSGRVGRSSAAKDFEPSAIEMAVRAYVRHCHTSYDRLLAGGMDRHDARAAVRDETDKVAERWQRPR